MSNKIKLLFADDEEPLRILVKNHLLLEGFEVETVDDGDTAIDAMKKNTYDIVLLDIRMPRLNGIDVLKSMKQMKIRSRIIMLTAVDDLAVAIEAVKNGANDYITKPYDLDKLLECIHRVLAK